MPWRTTVKSQLFPVSGLNLEPAYPEGEINIEGDFQPTFAIMVAKGLHGLVAVEATSDGSLKTGETGAGLEVYEVFAGTAVDAATALGIAAQSARADLYITAFSIDIAFQKADDSWHGDIVLPVGNYSLDFTFKDIRINNTVGGGAADSVYQIVAWS